MHIFSLSLSLFQRWTSFSWGRWENGEVCCTCHKEPGEDGGDAVSELQQGCLPREAAAPDSALRRHSTALRMDGQLRAAPHTNSLLGKWGIWGEDGAHGCFAFHVPFNQA